MKATLIVQNLKCGGCAKTIINRISELEHVSNVEVNVESSSVTFEYKDLEDALEVKKNLGKIGYPSVDMANSTMSMLKSYVSCATGKMK